ncbi:MAG TPA: type II toxin-antitoxin system VapC family toxin [Ilumatobacteraceae bacterium]|nr:type II toxin-antitoxin system VapC family toxin [Ilumatobacteraceae bacterium]
MTTYVDSSALLKRYVDEPDSTTAERLLLSDPLLVTSWLTLVEVRRDLPRLLDGPALREAKQQFTNDLDAFAMVAIDEAVCRAAAQIGEQLVVRSLDAIHLASAQRLVVPGLPFITFDLRQAQAARSLGFTVLGN